jgi:2-polyprenyl-3-methyl-5-hydroxy-6-metoxy-1,4-benzoquinol methylase
LFMSTLNQTMKSYLLAIIGAEYILNLLTRGTHDWYKFISPDKLTQYITAPLSSTAAAHDTFNQQQHYRYITAVANKNVSIANQPFDVIDMHGILFNPLTKNMWLSQHDFDVNYIVYARSRGDVKQTATTEQDGKMIRNEQGLRTYFIHC